MDASRLAEDCWAVWSLVARSDVRTSHDPLVASQDGLQRDRPRGWKHHDGDAALVVETLAMGADVIEVAVRTPCERCGTQLYYHEQRERWCRSCALALGVLRMCDKARRP